MPQNVSPLWQGPRWALAVLLAILGMLGPFSIDTYIPAFSGIAQALNATPLQMQQTLSAYLFGFAFMNLFHGAMADSFGRRPVVLWGLAVFTLASAGCALSQNITQLVLFRALQGLSTGAGIVVSRAVVRDLFPPAQAQRVMAQITIFFGIAPALAPVLGGGVIAVSSWRGVFWAVAVAAVIGLAAVFMGLKETRGAAARLDSSVAGALRAYGVLLRDWHYLGLVFIGGCAMAGFFVYLAGSPFVLINYYGLSSTQYSLAFGLNAIAFIGAAQFTGWLGQRFGLVRVVKVAATGSGLVMLSLLSYYLLGGERLAVLIGLYFVASALMGLVIPTTSVLALEEHGAIAGTASALLGTLQMLSGAAAMQIVGLFSTGKPLPMVVGMATGALIGVALAWITLGGARAHRVGAKGHS